MSKYFSEIFKKLAPEGHAVLVMKKGDQDQGVGGPVDQMMSRENMSTGFQSRSDTNWAVQTQKMARGLKF